MRQFLAICLLIFCSALAGSSLTTALVILENGQWLLGRNSSGTSLNLMRVTTDNRLEIRSPGGSNGDLILSGEGDGTRFRFDMDASDIFCYENALGSCHIFTNTSQGSDNLSWSISPAGSQDVDRAPISTWYGNNFTTNDRDGQIRHIGGNTTHGDVRSEINNAEAQVIIAHGSTDLQAVGIDGITDYLATLGSSSKDPTSDAPDDWLEIKIDGNTLFVPAYAGS